MRIDEYLDLSHTTGGEQDYSPSMAVIELYSKFESVQKLPPEIALNLRGDNIIIASRDGKLTVTAYIHKDFIDALFAVHKKKTPRSILKLKRYAEYFLVDLESFETDTIRFYLPKAGMDFALTELFPFTDAISEMNKSQYVGFQLVGFFVDYNNDAVTQYKYYLLEDQGNIHNFRFDGKTKSFLSKHVEVPTLLSSEETLTDPDFGDLFNEDSVDYIYVGVAERQDVNQRYLSIKQRDMVPEGVDISTRGIATTVELVEPEPEIANTDIIEE